MELLITVQEIRKIRSIAESIDDIQKVEPFILEAQQIELRDLLGVEFFYNILAVITVYRKNLETNPAYQPTTEELKFIDLLNGGKYNTNQGHEIYFSGIATVLSYFSYGRFLVNDNIKHTNAGFVYKQSQFSEHVSQSAISAKHQDARSMALSHWADVVLFLDTNKSSYPLWRSSCKASSTNIRSSIKITSINNRK